MREKVRVRSLENSRDTQRNPKPTRNPSLIILAFFSKFALFFFIISCYRSANHDLVPVSRPVNTSATASSLLNCWSLIESIKWPSNDSSVISNHPISSYLLSIRSSLLIRKGLWFRDCVLIPLLRVCSEARVSFFSSFSQFKFECCE